MNYALVDLANTFFRCRHIAKRGSTIEEKCGMALHLTLNSVASIVRKFDIDHVVFCLEGRSWRKDFYGAYKINRAEKVAKMSPAEAEENQQFWDTYSKLTTFLLEKTNTSVIRHPRAEGDDVIARWIALHPHDTHWVISSDTDFAQLLADNVHQYNGITDEIIRLDGVTNSRGRVVKDKKTGQPKTIGDPRYVLFEKCMRGDSTDWVKPAYPGVRTKSTKNRVGLLDAWADRNAQGFKWNNMMLQHWVDPDGVQHLVRDVYERNRVLIDLTLQPQEIKDSVDEVIRECVRTTACGGIGLNLLRFCGQHDLEKISENATLFTEWLSKPYTGVLNECK